MREKLCQFKSESATVSLLCARLAAGECWGACCSLMFPNAVLGDFSVTKNVWSVGLLPLFGVKNVSENPRSSVWNWSVFFPYSPRQDWDWCTVELSCCLTAPLIHNLRAIAKCKGRFSGVKSNWRSHFYYLGEKEYPAAHISHSLSVKWFQIPRFLQSGRVTWVQFVYIHSASVASIHAKCPMESN